ncbi:MAG TPA: antitoxin Xre/MbcA/ParS toxin-binding domain-containing protein, partial [Rhodanobacteraceae bacterium]|nr:antitoxin Xre/MbcA/ParS toxin-binding domain-containing protein [Rhodanobacteraceae bacterium]
SIPDTDPARVLTQATLRAADLLEIPQRTLADIIGVSASTISRAANGGAPVDPASKSGELAKLWVRVFRSLDAIVGSNDVAARARLNSANAAFGGEKPVDRLRSAEGLIQVLQYLDSARGRP